MEVKELIYRFKMGMNKMDTQQKPDLRINQIIMYFNDAQNRLVEADYSVDPQTGLSLEATQKRIDDLSNLHVTFETLSAVPIKKGVVGFDLTKLKSPYLHLTRKSFIGERGACKKVTLFPVHAQTDDLNVILEDPDRQPNFDWREVPARAAGDMIHAFYTDFEIKTMEVDYIRYPNRIDIAGYTHFNGEPSKTMECEMKHMYQLKIIDKAVQLASLDLNSPTTQMASAKLMDNAR